MTYQVVTLPNKARLVVIDELISMSKEIALKDIIGRVVSDYQDKLTNLVYDVWNGHSDAIDLRRAQKALLREYAPRAYVEGMRDGGIDEPDDDDKAVADEKVSDWLSAQVEFVNDFAKAVGEARKDKEQRKSILDRVGMWADSLRALSELGRAYAMGNVKAEWRLGDRATHTQDCIDFSRLKPHRVTWWTERGRTPPIHLGCGCALVDVKSGETIMGE